jgi:uncharacterized protein (TIGR03435 family)
MLDVKLSRVGALAGVVGLMLGLGGELRAQAIVGTWQGTLPDAAHSRLAVKISKTDAGALRGVFYRIDHDNGSIPLSSLTFTPPEVNLASMFVDTTFHGVLSADGKTITGTWAQDKQTYPLTLNSVAAENVWTYAGAPVPIPPMAADADPAFEVGTVKPSAPDERRKGRLRTRHFELAMYTVADLIEFGYQLRSRQIEGGPAWFDESRFDITGEPDLPGQPSQEQYRRMVQKLLADRFGLKVHIIQKDFPVYALTRGKDALKLTPSDPSMNTSSGIAVKQAPDGEMTEQFMYMTMPEFDNLLMNFIRDRQIVDATGLTGRFDFTMNISQAAQNTTDDDERTTAFLTAVQALGLKLVPRHEPLQVLVIDRLEKPSAN